VTAALESTRAQAAQLVLDASRDETMREAAVRAVKPVEVATLGALLEARQPPRLQLAAAEQLGRNDSEPAARVLLGGWSHFAPVLRERILGILTSREGSTRLLLAAIRSGEIPAGAVSAITRDRLLKHPNSALRDQARAAFESVATPARAEVLAQYQSAATLRGVPTRGQPLFERLCASCHAHAGVGQEVGPTLAVLRDKDPAYWLKNILDPNAVVEPRYVSYNIETRDGRSLSGLLQGESSTTLTLVQPNALKETILRQDITEIRASGVSLMPEGLEQNLVPQDLADLIAFLRQSGPPRQFPGNHPALVRAEPDGSLRLAATNAEIYGGEIAFETQFQNIGMWHGSKDHVAWSASVPKAGLYDVYLDYACAAGAAGNSFALEATDYVIRDRVASTGTWDVYRQLKVGAVQLNAGEQRLVFRPEAELTSALIDLRTVVLSPHGVPQRWPRAAALDGLPRDPAALARVILDPTLPQSAREAAVNANPQFGPALLREMTRDLVPGTPDEYQRIPWIWRVAILAGKRNDPTQLLQILEVSLPEPAAPLQDWQAVVLGGGIINGLSQQALWPGERLNEILLNHDPLKTRWQRALELAAAKADDSKVPTGTRYDALRMLGVEPWEKRGAQVVRYLSRDTHAELQMGAVSALNDMKSVAAGRALLDGLADCSPSNRQLALEALLRDDQRVELLLEAIGAARVQSSDLAEAQRRKLKEYPQETIRLHAQRVLAR
jgi:putative heme-binding domain-containing protein